MDVIAFNQKADKTKKAVPNYRKKKQKKHQTMEAILNLSKTLTNEKE
jgi:hypothetical protein